MRRVSSSIRRLFDILFWQRAEHPLSPALVHVNPEPTEQYTTEEAVAIIERIGMWALHQGFRKGDRFSIVARNCPAWTLVDHGLLQLGMVNVPLYPTLSAEEYEFILREAEVKVVFVGDAEIWSRLKPAVEACGIKNVYAFTEIEGLPHWEEIKRFAPPTDSLKHALEEARQQVAPTDLATIIYTSGTTGFPKGVMLSHDNILSNVRDCVPLMPLSPGQAVLSFLPLNHSFERTMVYIYQASALPIYFVSDLDQLVNAIQRVRPYLFATVPRLLERVYERIVERGLALRGIKRALFFWSLRLGRDWDPERKPGLWKRIQHGIADRLVFRRWREALGGRVVALISGGAALRPDLARIFWCAGIPIMEGYGLTESSPVISVNRLEPDGFKIGTVGPPLDSVEVRIAEDGEILVRGPNVMLGYYKREKETREVIDEDGWLHTGDIGTLVPGKKYRFLKITDRKKELIKTAGGKYVAPQPIENALKASMLIENAMVVGEGKKFPAVLIVPDENHLKGWAAREGLNLPVDQLLTHDKVIARYRAIIQRVNAPLSQPEKIKRFVFVRDHWTQEGGELTPTLKLKRRVLLERYAALIDDLYAGKAGWDVYPERRSHQ